MSGPNQLQKLRGEGQATRVQDNIGQILNPLAARVNATPIGGAPPPPWIRPSLVGGYSQAAAPQPVCAYHKDALGYVHTKLSMTHATGPAAGVVAFTYGLGFRQGEVLTFTLADGFGLSVMMVVSPNGEISNLTPIPAGDDVRGYFVFLAGP